MTSNKQDQQPFEAPTLEVIGTIHEITKSGTAPNADVFKGKNNTAFPPGSAG
jgi:hypothetical protein